MHRIVSLSPVATELVEALDLGDALVGVPAGSHRVDLPAVTRSPFGRSPAAPPADVAVQIRDAVDNRVAVVEVDEEAVGALAPTLVLRGSDGICGPEADDAVPVGGRSIEECLASLGRLGEALGDAPRAASLVAQLSARLDAIHRSARDGAAVLALVWGDPPWVVGGLSAELLTHVGARPLLSSPTEAARPVSGADMVGAGADHLFYLPCGYTIDEAEREARAIAARPEAQAIEAVSAGRMWALESPRSIVSAVALAEAMASVLDGAPSDARRVA